MAELTERQWVQRLRERFRTESPSVRVGIGDDAAVLAGSGEDWVCSVDCNVEGVHFDLRYLSLYDVGYRAFQAAASDLAAMGAQPLAALSALILPRTATPADIDELTLGQRAASLECGCPIVGGNLSRGGELSLTTTVFGHGRKQLPRSGARPGEQLWLVGSVGLAAAGFACLRRGTLVPILPGEPREAARGGEGRRRAIERCVNAWRRPRALIQRGQELAECASSAIDVSDGLAADAAQLARASGVRLVLEQERLRSALDACLLEASRGLRRSALRFALYGGEDYALLATGPAARRPSWAQPIGRVERGAGAVLDQWGCYVPLGRGYDHFARR